MLRAFSKILCFSTIGLIFAGALVTSTDSGLAVPDWPLSFGTLFPPMVGGVVYEHSHRVIAGVVALLTGINCALVYNREKRKWVRFLSYAAFIAVILQALLGGLTVLLQLPPLISVSHALLAQTFFVLTVIIAYSQSAAYLRSNKGVEKNRADNMLKIALVMVFVVYVQLILGAWMRHTYSGLAVPDFPKSGGFLWPFFVDNLTGRINALRTGMGLGPVEIYQICIHLAHRFFALIVLAAAVWLNLAAYKHCSGNKRGMCLIMILNIMLVCQIALGASTIWSMRQALITSGHVMLGALILGVSVIVALEFYPFRSLPEEPR